MNKRMLSVLEKMFAREVQASLDKWNLPPVFQSGAKIMKDMDAAGLIEYHESTLGGPLPMTIKGYLLTHKGRMAYCEARK